MQRRRFTAEFKAEAVRQARMQSLRSAPSVFELREDNRRGIEADTSRFCMVVSHLR